MAQEIKSAKYVVFLKDFEEYEKGQRVLMLPGAVRKNIEAGIVEIDGQSQHETGKPKAKKS